MNRNIASAGELLNRTFLCLMGTSALFAPALCRAQGYTITTVTGGASTSIGGSGTATSAIFQPVGVAVDAAGNLYLAEDLGAGLYDFISQVSPDGISSTIAGTPTSLQGFSGDGGPATSAQFHFQSLSPAGIAVDSAGNLFIADTSNQRIRIVSTNGMIMTVAGGGGFNPIDLSFGDGGQATSASLGKPQGVAVDSAGNLYIADSLLSRVRKVAPDGTITTVAGCVPSVVNTACLVSLGDGGPATSAMLNGPTALALDSGGNLYIADTGNNRIRMLSTGGTITTVAGSGAGSYRGDGGPATGAGLNQPSGVAVDSAGNIYIDDSGDYRIRMVTPAGTITTIAGNGAQRQFSDSSGDGGPATSARLSLTTGIAVDGGGNAYIADPVYGVRLLTPSTQ